MTYRCHTVLSKQEIGVTEVAGSNKLSPLQFPIVIATDTNKSYNIDNLCTLQSLSDTDLGTSHPRDTCIQLSARYYVNARSRQVLPIITDSAAGTGFGPSTSKPLPVANEAVS